MAFLTKEHLSRRAVLRGAGVTLALPFLESMVPAVAALGQTAAAGARTRLGCVYFPHGAIMSRWTPATEGNNGYSWISAAWMLERSRPIPVRVLFSWVFFPSRSTYEFWSKLWSALSRSPRRLRSCREPQVRSDNSS